LLPRYSGLLNQFAALNGLEILLVAAQVVEGLPCEEVEFLPQGAALDGLGLQQVKALVLHDLSARAPGGSLGYTPQYAARLLSLATQI
jgi:hypothetical protein